MLDRIILAIGLLLALASPVVAQSGCSGQFKAGQYCGNVTSSQGVPGPTYQPMTNPDDLAAFTPIKRKILLGGNNVKIVVLSDSTGAHPDTQFYEWWQAQAPSYPTFTVRVFFWDLGTENYGSPTTLQTGTGCCFIDLYLAAYAGANFVNWLGSRFANAVTGIAADLFIINLGLNVAGPASTPIALRSYMDGIQSVLTQKSGTPVAMNLQQPFQNTNGMAVVNAAQYQLKNMYPGISLVDIYSKFIAAGKPSSWYLPADNTHTSAIGTAVQVAAWLAAWNAAGTALPAGNAYVPWITSFAGTNILYNGDFTDGGGYLTGWTSAGGTVTRDTVEHFPGKASSVKIVNSNTGHITQTFDATQLAMTRGKTITCMMRRRIVPGAVSSFAGVLEVFVNGKNNPGTLDSFHFNAGDGEGGYFITTLAGINIPFDAATVTISDYASGNTDAATINIDENWCGFGSGTPTFQVLYN